MGEDDLLIKNSHNRAFINTQRSFSVNNSNFFKTLLKIITPFVLGTLLVACNDADMNDETEPVPSGTAQAAVQQGLVGVVLGEITTAKISFDSAGTIRKSSMINIHPSHYFALGSNGKSITALLAAKMVESGIIEWNSRILDVLPELKGNIREEYLEVTLEQLLSHKSGMIPLTDEEEARNYDGGFPENAWERRLKTISWMLNQEPVSTPGLDFNYSNAGYTVAGAMLEKLGQDTYLNLVDQWVLEPLGLSAIMTMPATTLDKQPLGYLGQKNNLIEIDPQDEQRLLLDDVISPAGSLCMTAQDYAKYLQWHLLALSGKNTPIPFGYIEKLQQLKNGEYTLGWQQIENSLNKDTVLMHLGETDGFTAFAILDQAGYSAAFGLTNTASDDERKPWVSALLEESAIGLFIKAKQ
jgi:CubicO group peptidase (beta-lactamase class C family)